MNTYEIARIEKFYRDWRGPFLHEYRRVTPLRYSFRLRGLCAFPDLAGELITFFEAIPSLSRCRVWPRTGKVVLEFKEEQSVKVIERSMRDYLCSFSTIKKSGMTSSGTPSADYHHWSWQKVLRSLSSDINYGLENGEVKKRHELHGLNLVGVKRARTNWEMVSLQFKSMPVALLCVSAGASALSGGLLDAAVIMGVVVANAGIGFKTESMVEKVISSLTRQKWGMASVLRNSVPREVPAEELVPGDIIKVVHGEIIPADIRLVKVHDLSVDESTLTGESGTVLKNPNPVAASKNALADRHCMLYRGTVVTGGSGKGIVVATGENTELGKIQQLMEKYNKPMSPLHTKLEKLGSRSVTFSLAMCGLTSILGIIRGQNPSQVLKNSISLAIAAVPEGLPTVATVTLAVGVKRLKKENVIVRNLNSLEAMGGIHYLCMDKTGTITQDEMIADKFVVGTKILSSKTTNTQVEKLLELAVLNSELSFDDDGTLVGSATEKAMASAYLNREGDLSSLRERYPRTHIRYRAEGRNYVKTTHQRSSGEEVIIIKGRPREVLADCSHWFRGEKLEVLTEKDKKKIMSINHQMASESLRVLGVASSGMFSKGKENVWIGLVGLKDRIKEGVEELLWKFRSAGIFTTMITGDQAHTAEAIGKKIRINGHGEFEVLAADELEQLSREDKKVRIPRTTIFSRVSPSHKLEIIKELQDQDYSVAMIGDGVNDGPALKKSNVGVVMGEKGADAAREVADVVILDDKLSSIEMAVREGRTVSWNIKKTVEYIFATNLSEMTLTLASAVLGLPTPLSAMQLLWINLMTDVLPEMALSTEEPPEDIMQMTPEKFHRELIGKSDGKKILRDSLAMSTSSMLIYLLGVNKSQNDSRKASTMAFYSLTGSQLLYSLLKSESRKSRPWENKTLMGALGFGGVMQLAACTPLMRRLLEMERLNFSDKFVTLIGVLAPIVYIDVKNTTV